ncbi:MAG: sialate O-acetylesterase [Planctomycetaceae bacterium]|nr:sialate O-acetylesterase [Planctomycetaceae bacterium]|tara:strand:- start:754 stop:1821 length:1068 start_codon:yes stop_codon:yes gene_type:complete
MINKRCFALLTVIALLFQSITVKAQDRLPDPDGKPADLTKPVQVYILLGQSNMLGAGKVTPVEKDGTLLHAVTEKNLYPYLVDNAGEWTTRADVRNMFVMGSGTGGVRRLTNELLTIKGGKIGPEIGIGHHLGHAIDAPVLLLKSCIGNRSLGWDLLPPGSDSFDFKEGDKRFHYAGYKESPLKWEVGTAPEKINWYAGMQYDGDVARAKAILKNLEKHYPGTNSYEIAGFFWWQGDKDRYNPGHANRYEQNLVHLIQQLRKDFDAPNAKFVCATLGQTAKDAEGIERQILDAQLAVDGNAGKYQAFKGNVASVYSHPLSKGGASNGHYDGNAETYMNIGEAMGKAMVKLLKAEK